VLSCRLIGHWFRTIPDVACEHASSARVPKIRAMRCRTPHPRPMNRRCANELCAYLPVSLVNKITGLFVVYYFLSSPPTHLN
ncbi:MAG TPA: hypothetical protein VED37_16700, partial [Ktedonobacteraceae bacterium]|nr:hypothetical protein [Ktedonobacteraceae bacterium]